MYIDKVSFPLGEYAVAELQSFECRKRNKGASLLLSGIEPAVVFYALNPSVESCAALATSCRDALEHFKYVCATLGNLDRCQVVFVLCSCNSMKAVLEANTAPDYDIGKKKLRELFAVLTETSDATSVLAAIVADFETAAEDLKAKSVRTIVIGKSVQEAAGVSLATQLCEVLQEVQEDRVAQAERRIDREAKQTTVSSTEGFTTFIVALVPLVALLLYYTFRTKPTSQ